MVLCFAACGEQPEDVRGEQDYEYNNDTETPDDADDAENADDVEDAEDAENAEDEDDAEGEPEKEFDLGEVAGLTYSNEFIGIACKLPGDWTFSTDEEIAQVNQVSEDLAGEEYKEAVAGSSAFTDMAASNGISNVNVVLQKSTYTAVAATDVAEAIEGTIPTLETSFEQMGYTNIDINVEKVTMDGEEYDALVTTAEIEGFEMNQINITMKCGNYFASITATTLGDDLTPQEIIDCFYHI